MKIFRVVLECPHCHVEQRVIINPPRKYEKTSLTVMCSASENKGCLKQFDIHQEIYISTTPTHEQLRIKENERINSPEHQADRMGG